MNKPEPLDINRLRARIDQEFTGECHLTSAEARLLFDVYEAACAWRDDRAHVEDEPRDRGTIRGLTAAVDAARSTS